MYDLTLQDSFLRRFEQSVKACWDKTALVEYNQPGISYGELAAELEKTCLWWRAAGLLPGDKIAINARSSANWAKTFFAAQTGGFVAVQLFNGFTPADTMHLVDHSDSRILYTEKRAFSTMDFEQMPQVLCAIDCGTGEVLASREGVGELYAGGAGLLAEKYPAGMRPEDFSVIRPDIDDVCAILPLDTALKAADAIRKAYVMGFVRYGEDGAEELQGTVPPGTAKLGLHLGKADKISISGAIVIAHHKEPLREVLRDAHTVLDGIAKERAGRDALATMEYIFAAIDSYESGGQIVRPHALPAYHGDPTIIH